MSVRTLEVKLNGILVGHLTHYPDERNLFVVDQRYVELGPTRPILSLSMARPGDEDGTQQLLQDERFKSSSVRAPPYFSNLLPEGGLRRRIAAELKIHEDREFDMLLALGGDLPGAVILTRADTPDYMRHRRSNLASMPEGRDIPPELRASLAGMQLKFSMLRQGERFTFAGAGQQGNFILKPPSNDFEDLPRLEAATMAVAKAAGIETPEVALVERSMLDGVEKLSSFREAEPFYAIRRFDRLEGGGRRHTEDFAQIFNLRASEKYGQVNYEQIARTLLLYAGGLDDLREMTRRLVLNVLIGNGDAHVKNWSLLYEDPRRPRLAPAYDLVATIAYTSNDDSIALNMGKIKKFKEIGLDTFSYFLQRVGIADQYRDDVMTVVMAAGNAVLTKWEQIFVEFDVPPHLIEKVRTHVSGLRLGSEL